MVDRIDKKGKTIFYLFYPINVTCLVKVFLYLQIVVPQSLLMCYSIFIISMTYLNKMLKKWYTYGGV